MSIDLLFHFYKTEFSDKTFGGNQHVSQNNLLSKLSSKLVKPKAKHNIALVSLE